MKKLYSLCLALLALGSSAWAATPGMTFLFSNGEKASFAFASKPEIAVTADGLSVSSTKTEAVAYQFAEVVKYYFEDDVTETGISQVSGAETVQHPVFSYADGMVIVSGMAASGSLVVSSVSGSQVGATKADGAGSASVDISGQPAGVYVVSTGSGVSFKLLKK